MNPRPGPELAPGAVLAPPDLAAAAASGRFRLPRLGLRARVAALCALLGFVVSACLALVAVHFSDSYVHRLIDEMLRVEGDYMHERYQRDGILPQPRSKHFHAYAGDGAATPPEYSSLAPGLHELEDDRGERHVAVYPVADRRMYVVLDIGLESVRERRLARDLAALVLFGGALSCWLGWFWAGRAIEPVRRLALQVETLDPAQETVARMAPGYAADEVGALAVAFDRYQGKLLEYVHRERAFTADASHELRTPLAVIRGAIEVLLDQNRLDAAAVLRLQRIQRGADELADLLDALLVLARGAEREPADAHGTDLGELVDRVLRERHEVLAAQGVRVDRETGTATTIAAPRKVLGVVIANLLRATTQFASGGVLQVRVGRGELAMSYGLDADRAARPLRDAHDAPLGLSMIRRVCERRGWVLDDRFDANNARGFVLRFSAPA